MVLKLQFQFRNRTWLFSIIQI